MRRVLDWLRAAPWYLWATVLTVGIVWLALCRRDTSTASRHLHRTLTRARDEARREDGAASAELASLDSVHDAAHDAITDAGDAAVAEVGRRQSQRKTVGRRNVFWLAVLLPLLPPPSLAQSFDPAPPSFSEVPRVDTGPCLPGEGAWHFDGLRRCVSCPPLSEYAVAGDLPGGCVAPVPGVLIVAPQFDLLEQTVARAEAERDEAVRRLTESQRRERAALTRLDALASGCAEAADVALELRDESSDGASWLTVAGVGIVGAAAGALAVLIL